MSVTKYQVRIYQILSEEFEVVTGLKQGDALSPLLINIALEKVIRSVQNNKLGTSIGTTQIKPNTSTLIEMAESIGLKINQEKTRVMELLPNEEQNINIGKYTFEKVKQFKYLGSIIINNNDWSLEVVSRIHKAERAYFALH